MIKDQTEILIIGGGIAGCIAAISLVEHFDVCLIDKLEKPKERIGESLAPAAQRILSELDLCQNLDPELEDQLYRKNLGMQSYWGSDQVHIVDHMRNPDGLGLNLDRKIFEIYLREKAEQRGIRCLWSTQLLKSSYENETWCVEVRSGKTERKINCEYVIDATGRSSIFSRQLGIERVAIDNLIACWVTLDNSLENKMSTITATQNGWWYSAVIPGEKRIIAFQTDSDLLPKSTFKSLEAFIELSKENNEITDILDQSDLSTLKFHGVRSANSTILNQACGSKWAAIGDAAMSFDPLSSQGMYNAMACALQLRDLLKEFRFSIKTQNIYTDQISSIWNQYIAHKNLFYNYEKRWINEEFWKRRHN